MSSATACRVRSSVGEAEGRQPLGGRLGAERAGARERRRAAAGTTPARGRSAPGARWRGQVRIERLGRARRRGVRGTRARGPGDAAASRSAGTVWVWRSSSSCRACSTRRRNAVGAGEHVGVVAGRRSPPSASAVEGGERGRGAQLRVDPAVHELEELRGELDVADARRARASPRGRPRPRWLTSSSARTLSARTWRRASAPNGRAPQRLAGRPRASAAPERRIAGHGRGLEQGLALPRRRPTAPSRPRRRRGCARGGRRGPRAAGRRPPGSSGRPARGTADRPAPGPSGSPSPTSRMSTSLA